MSGVTNDMIRTALGDLDPGEAVSNETIDVNIEIAETIVDEHASDGVSSSLYRAAVIDVAKHRTVSKNRQSFVKAITTQSSKTDFDVRVWIDDLRVEKEEALALVAQNTPSFATAGDRTRGMW